MAGVATVSEVQMVEVLRFAREAGFTLLEIKKLFPGFEGKAPLGARWRALAQVKLRDLDELQARVLQMRRAIERGLECDCIRIEDCALVRTGGASARAAARARGARERGAK
jgi:MerR family transcriptional regulator, redox-sensitive transcriptional activator SoxR